MGKRTTTRHKEDNTFRFQTFEEKLKNISINVNLSIRDGRTDLPEDETTFFSQEIEKWVDLNRTESFGELLTQIGDDIQSLPQVLLQKEKLAEVLVNHLENRDNVPSYEPTFALTIALARDLGPDFYPYFPKLFKSIIEIVISLKSPEVIEQGFKCYAYLSKYLRRQILKDIPHHLRLFAPLLNPKLKNYVVIFACEAFEVVVSKYARDNGDTFLDLVFKLLLQNKPENAVGFATLLCAMFKGVNGSLKIVGPGGFKFQPCLNYTFHLSENDDKQNWIAMLKILLTKLLNHANESSTKALFDIFENSLLDPKQRHHAPTILLFYRTIVEYENCSKIPDVGRCVNVLKIVCDSVIAGNGQDLLFENFCQLVITLLAVKGKSTNPEILTSLKSTIIKLFENGDLDSVTKIDAVLQDTSHYFHSYLSTVVRAYERVQVGSSNPLDLDIKAIKCISDAVLRQQGLYHPLKKTEPHFFTGFAMSMWFYENQKKLIRPLNLTGLLSKDAFNCCEAMQQALESLSTSTHMENLLRLFLSYSRISVSECKNCVSKCRQIANLVISHNEMCEDTQQQNFSMLLLFILETLIMHGPTEPSLETSFCDVNISKFLSTISNVIVGAYNASSPFCIWSLKCLDVIVHYAKISSSSSSSSSSLRLEVIDYLNGLKGDLMSNLQSGFKIVRTIALSILRNLLHMENSSDAKMLEMCDKFIQVEDMSVLNPKFSPMVKSTLTEAKVLMESENASQEIKRFCLKYTLGLMYSNFKLIWPICIEVVQLAGKNMKFDDFWSIFGSYFLMHFPESSNGAPRRNIVTDVYKGEENEFLQRVHQLTFGFPSEVSNNLGVQEIPDISQYRVNLWKSIIGLPFTKVEYQEIKCIIDKTITNSFDDASIERGFTGELNRTLVSVFEFLEKCEAANSDLQLWERCLAHLMTTPDVQKAVWEFLHAKRKNKLKGFKTDIDELIATDSMDSFHKFRVDAIDTSQSQQYQNETPEKRRLLMDIVIRVLIGKEWRWKAEKRLQSLRFIGGCSPMDAKKYLELTVGPGLSDLRISPKVIEVKINKVANCIRAWRYKFPTIMDDLLNLVCDLTTAIDNLKKPFPKHSDEEELPDAVFEEQKKGALKAARLCILAFFTFLPKFNLEQGTIERIFDVFIWKGLNEIKSQTGSSPSWIMKLFQVWSSHERFHVLFAKCQNSDFEEKFSPMRSIFEVLELSTIHFEIQKYLIDILLNLTMSPETLGDEAVVSEESISLDHAEKFDARPLNCEGIYKFDTSESIGMNVVVNGKHVILKLFEDVQLFKKFVNQPGGDRCLALISRLAEFVDVKDDAESLQRLCSIIIETFPIYKHSEENLYNCLVACKFLLAKIVDTKPFLLKLSSSFIWVNGRRLRSTLCDILSSQKDQFIYETIRDMNAWSDSAVDTPDFSTRQDAIQKLEKSIAQEPFDRARCTLAAANCFYSLLIETDIGVRNSSKHFLIMLSESLKSKGKDSQGEINIFLDSMIIPRLRGGIHHKDDGRFADFLQVYLAFIQNGKELHGTFKELDKVLSSDIIEAMYDIQIHLRTRAMNKLCIKIAEVGSTISPTILKNFVLPLANHNLLDEEKLGDNRTDLIHSSIETVKTILQFFSHDHYFKFLIHLINSPKKQTRLAKQYERILVATMDAYHFDLSLATGGGVNNKVKSVEEEVKAEDDNLEENEKEKSSEEVDDGLDGFTKADLDDQSETEEQLDKTSTIPRQMTKSLIPKSAAIKCLKLLKTLIVPKLRKYLNFEEKATHKLSKAEKKVDDDVILKIPCTLALVKLLKKLPRNEGETSIRSIIPCLCAGLRNELYSTRHSLRKTILSVIQELGISQFRSVIGYLKATLQRGYQKHVLNFTIGYFMKCLESELRANPSHLPIKEILPLCEDELYGVMQEEKELAAIRAKTKEAGKNNAHPILKLCAKCIQSKAHLSSLIEPAINRLAAKRSPRVAKTSRQWLNSISEGLADNVVIDHLELLDWLQNEVMKKENPLAEGGVVEEEGGPSRKKKRKLLVESKDAFLIATGKKKAAAVGKITGQFLLTEFSFNCLYNGLNKNTRLKESLLKSRSIQALDSFVKPLGVGIQLPSKQVNIVSLRCLTLLFEFELDSFDNEDLIDSLRRSGFMAMNNHCYRTSSDTQMSNATFKFLAAFFTRFPEYKIVVQDFELMLKCIQSYLTHEECSSSAITLLKGVLKNKFSSSNLQELMEEVFKQGIQSFYQHINEGCRQAYLTYLNNYCTTPKELTSQVRLILNQFDYSIQNGRQTAVEIMNSLLGSMPENCLEEVKELVFLKTLQCLDKEEHKDVRSKLADVIKSLFKSEGKKTLAQLFLKLIYSNNHNSELDTFFLVAGVLIEDHSIFSEHDFTQLLIKIEEILNPETFEELCDMSTNMTQQAQDYAIFQVLRCLKKGLDRRSNGYNLWERKSPHAKTMEAIFGHLRFCQLLYEHVWVPPVTLDILFHVIAKLQLSGDEALNNFATQLQQGNVTDILLLKDTQDLKILIKNIWTILKLENDHNDDIVMKGTLIFVQLTCVVARFSDLAIFEDTIGEVRKSVNHEVVKDQKKTRLRALAFACFRGIANNSPTQAVERVAEGLTRVAVRELTDEGVSGEIKVEAEKLTGILRTVLGNAEFNSLYAKVNDYYHKKRNMNRAKKKETAVIHPGLVRKRPIKPKFDEMQSKVPYKKAKKRN